MPMNSQNTTCMTSLSPDIHRHFPQIDSTNDYAKCQINSFSAETLSLVTADTQSAGRGRFTRTWVSPPQGNFYGSFVFYLPLTTHTLSCIGQLPQLLALSCINLLESWDFSPLIKWPNDLILNEKKLGGLLCETTPTKQGLAIILGLGVNLNMEKAILESIDQPATSLKVESQKSWDSSLFTQELYHCFKKDLTCFRETGFSAFFPSFVRYSEPYLKEKKLRARDGELTWEGLFHRLETDGSLTLLLSDGKEKTLIAGELY